MSVVVGGDVSEGDELRRVKLEKEEEVPAIKSDVSTESSSSIGQPDDDSDDEDEVQSTLSSFASLDDSLPIKRGLSKFYGGKSKSFGNLGEVKSLKEIGKADNPFNKRRRTLMAYNLMFKKDDSTQNLLMNQNKNNNQNAKKTKSGLFYAHSNPISMPLLPLAEDDDDDDDDGDGNIYGSSSSILGSHGFHRFEEKKSHPSIDDHHTSVNTVSSPSRLDVYSSVK